MWLPYVINGKFKLPWVEYACGMLCTHKHRHVAWCLPDKSVAKWSKWLKFFSLLSVQIWALFICPAKCRGWIFAWCRKFSSWRSLFVRVGKKKLCFKNTFYAASAGIVFRYLYQIFKKMPIMKNFRPNL